MDKILGGSVLKTKVIVISGVTASGKTTLINALSDTVENAYVLSFDDYSIDALPSAPSHAFLLKKFQRCSQFIRYYPVNERLFFCECSRQI